MKNDKNGNVNPNYQKELNGCFKWASYLAKENQKTSNPDEHRELFASRLPKIKKDKKNK